MCRVLTCCSVLVLAIAGNARAQTPKASSPDLKAMYEDIEILRRILAKELGAVAGSIRLPRAQNILSSSAYDLVDALTATAYIDVDGRLDLPAKRGMPTTIDGVYLKGHGVTYTLAVNGAEQVIYNASNKGLGLISICIKCHASASAERFLNSANSNRPAPKLSDWEKTRNEIRGDKNETQPSIAPSFMLKEICAPGNLTEKILKVLANNGYQFQQLPGGENITVVFTFSARSESAEPARKQSNAPPTLRAAQEHAALGDLHLKQQKYAEAIRSYAHAIKQLESGPLTFPADTAYDNVQQYVDDAQKLLRGSYAKQAHALLASGKTSEAKDALTKAESATVKLNMNNAAPAEKVSSNLPAKLIITVSKKALEQHHEGKLTLDQLRKEADVQAINLPPAEKKP